MRILSIQSHVVSGYVGNRAAAFPLQLLGHDVDVVNTVQFSNHTGYGYTNGHKTTPEQLEAVFEGLSRNGVGGYDRVLTGYIPGAEALKVVGERIKELKPEIYLLDPVMGDIGTGLYVSPDVVPIYQSMLHQATIITPNHFELELLSGTKITSLDTLYSALDKLHEIVPHIAVSSISLPHTLALPPPPTTYTPVPSSETLLCVASSRTRARGSRTVKVFGLPAIDGYFSGVGDLFSALVLAHFVDDLPRAVSKALHTVQMILTRTHIEAKGTTMRDRELRIIQEQQHITSGLEWPGLDISYDPPGAAS